MSREFFVSMPHGIFTADGVWFHTTEELLREFSPEVVEHLGLERLLREASAWARFPAHAAVWLLLVFLLSAPAAEAVLGALVVYVFLAIFGPGLVLSGGARLAVHLSKPVLQGLAYVGILSFLAADGRLGATGAGLAGFILLRWGVLDAVVLPIARRAPGMKRTLPAPDRTLRNLIIRYAMKQGTHTREVADMEASMLRIWNYRKSEKPGGGGMPGGKP